MKKQQIIALVVFIAGLPMLLHVFNPSMTLGGIGLILGYWGMTISPAAMFVYVLCNIFKK